MARRVPMTRTPGQPHRIRMPMLIRTPRAVRPGPIPSIRPSSGWNHSRSRTTTRPCHRGAPGVAAARPTAGRCPGRRVLRVARRTAAPCPRCRVLRGARRTAVRCRVLRVARPTAVRCRVLRVGRRTAVRCRVGQRTAVRCRVLRVGQPIVVRCRVLRAARPTAAPCPRCRRCLAPAGQGPRRMARTGGGHRRTTSARTACLLSPATRSTPVRSPRPMTSPAWAGPAAGVAPEVAALACGNPARSAAARCPAWRVGHAWAASSRGSMTAAAAGAAGAVTAAAAGGPSAAPAACWPRSSPWCC